MSLWKKNVFFEIAYVSCITAVLGFSAQLSILSVLDIYTITIEFYKILYNRTTFYDIQLVLVID